MNEYLIIGNGVAAAAATEGIRSVDKAGTITIVSEEAHPVYCRPLISYYLEKKTDISKMNYRDKDFYERNGCKVFYGKKAVRLDPEKKEVKLCDGTVLPYSKVCIATGSSPFTPDFPGIDTVDKKFGFMTLDDALSLEKAVGKDTRVFIIGAGLIGLKCAEGLRAMTDSITVCDLADRVLSSILDSDCAALMQAHMEKNGIRFLLSDTVERFDKNKAYMKSGRTVDFDVLVTAVGVKANTSLVKDAGGAVNRGIITDEHMRTSLNDVYAAGDCCESRDISSGTSHILAILPNAYIQGFAAGVNMAGGDRIFDNSIPMNSIGFFGLHAMTAGSYDGELIEEKNDRELMKFFVKDGLLKGFIFIGEPSKTGIYTSLIRERIPLDTIDFELLKKGADYMAFSPETRRKKFGGVV